jgi:hypothetical protein
MVVNAFQGVPFLISTRISSESRNLSEKMNGHFGRGFVLGAKLPVEFVGQVNATAMGLQRWL